MSTASSAEQTTRQTPSRVPELKIGTYHGRESVPSKRFFQRLFLGFEFTGESCSVSVVSGNNVTVSFIEDEIVSLAPYPAPDGNSYSDIFIGELNCPSSKQMGLLSVFHKGGSGSSLFDVKPLGVDGSSGGFGWSVF